MKKRELEQTRKLTRIQLEKKISEARLELKKNSVKIAGGAESNLKKAKNKKRELAQLMTILKNKPEKGEKQKDK